MREEKLVQLLVMATNVTEKNEQDGEEVLEEDVTLTGLSLPPLSILLACREFTPAIMEHEKAILVMKEHDYARVPDVTQLAPFLHRLSSNDTPTTTTKCQEKKRIATDTKSLLQNVRNTLSDYRRDVLIGRGGGEGGGGGGGGGSLISHFREMVSLQSILIHELQEQIHIRDIESTTVHREKEQLKARLERMERRMSILQKRSKDRLEPSDEAPPIPTTPPLSSLRAKPDSITRLTDNSPGGRRKSRSRSSSSEPSTSRRTSKHSLPVTPPINSLQVTHKANKRELDEEIDHTHTPKRSRSSTSENRKTRETYVRTTVQYNGLCLDLPDSMDEEEQTDKPSIKVPTWRDVLLSEEYDISAAVDEETSDEVYTKRHSKLESDEKRRKRWDAQRMREQFHHKQLMKRYMMKEGHTQTTPEKRKDKIITLQPKLENLEGIELMDSIIVSAFGHPLPKVPAKPFQLSNFNPHTAASKGGRSKARGRVSATAPVSESNHLS